MLDVKNMDAKQRLVRKRNEIHIKILIVKEHLIIKHLKEKYGDLVVAGQGVYEGIRFKVLDAGINDVTDTLGIDCDEGRHDDLIRPERTNFLKRNISGNLSMIRY